MKGGGWIIMVGGRLDRMGRGVQKPKCTLYKALNYQRTNSKLNKMQPRTKTPVTKGGDGVGRGGRKCELKLLSMRPKNDHPPRKLLPPPPPSSTK